MSVEVTPDGLQVAFGTPIKWEGETVGTNGEAPEVGPDTDGGSWDNGGDDSTNGETSSVGPGTSTDGWNGTDVPTGAEINEVNPGNSTDDGNKKWEGSTTPVEAGKDKLGE